ncbi:uncharacterized protein LOC111448274 [Cucurbita moschata]|uniref:Uncharacterized protein LOC111448274 n=1 Tax=Cucurbita moschata TaxID=3662 RepID=A0A6J1FXX2_CUCMO|nr:uncharacterized protein LOC111448274 [Cucurbita moschata]
MSSAVPPSYAATYGAGGSGGEPENFGDQAMEFVKAAGEMAMEFGKGCRDIVLQSFGDNESYIVKTFGKGSYIEKKVRGPCEKVCGKLRFINDYLPEDKDPFHAWMVILSVSVVVLAVLTLSVQRDDLPISSIKKVYIHPPSARRVMLPDGRFLAYKEQGVSADRARFSIIGPHSFLSSRLAGMPGLKTSLLEEFGIRLLTYDLPGFGESDPHPQRNLESSAMDMSFLANAVGVNDRFWVIGYSTGSMHAWAALRYIPDKLAGAAMFAPMVNPYDPSMTKEERRATWKRWSRKRKFMYFLARRFPPVLPLSYRNSFLSGKHDQIDKWLALSLGKRDRALVEDPIHEEFWQRDVEESIRQGNTKPFVEEATLLVSDWGFRLHDLRLQKRVVKSVIHWLKSLLGDVQDDFTGFLGPIHIWQGMDDMVVPPSMTDYVHRILPGAAVHKLPYEGHFTYIYFCDECHRQIFTTLFGTPQGQLNNCSVDQTSSDCDTEDLDVRTVGDSATE